MFVSFCFLFWHVCKLSWQTEQATLPPPVSSLPVGQRGPLRNAYGVANEACLMFRKWLANVHVNEVKLCYCKFCQVVVMWPHISQPELHRCSLVKFGLAVWLVHWLCFGLAGPVALRPRSLVSDNAGSCSCHRFARLGSRSPACKAKTNGTEETWLEGMTWWRDMTRECLCFLDVFGMSCFFVNSQDLAKVADLASCCWWPIDRVSIWPTIWWPSHGFNYISSIWSRHPFHQSGLNLRISGCATSASSAAKIYCTCYIYIYICTLHYITLRYITLHTLHT